MNPRTKLPVFLALLCLLPAAGSAQSTPTQSDANVPPIAGESKFGVGITSSYPAYGISGLYDMSEKVTLQAVLGAFGSVTAVSGRGMFRFDRKEKYDWYGFGTVGMWTCTYCSSTLGFGGGAGAELKWSKIFGDADFPPLFSTFELGMVTANLGNAFSGFFWGGGLHYRF